MAKKQDFMSKTLKSEKHGNICPVCNTPISFVRVVNTEKSKKTDSWRFNQNHTGVCQCNEKEVYN
jgi:DNA repair exonuclease SbcCD ATPase subunit